MRVLAILLNKGDVQMGGVQKFLMEVFDSVDHEKIQMDFLSPANETLENERKNIEKDGGGLYNLGVPRDSIKNRLKYNKALTRFLKEHGPYDVVHINSGALPFVLQTAIAAKKCEVKRIIAHSHNYDPRVSFVKKAALALMKQKLMRVATDYVACSEIAARNLFSESAIEAKKIQVIRNGIDIKKFVFDSEARRVVRKSLGVNEGCKVYGHVGNFVEPKNHKFLIEVFRRIASKDEDARLVLVGDGSLRSSIENMVKSSDLDKKVIFVGQQKDLKRFYGAFDYFVLPSTVEGFGLVLVEASASGLPIFCTDFLKGAVGDLDDARFLALEDGAEMWAEEILVTAEKKEPERKMAWKKVVEKGYGVGKMVEQVQRLYWGD